MQLTFAALTAICSVAFLTYAPNAVAGSGRSIRADLPCPYGQAGAPNPDAWSAGTPSTLINPNPGLLTPNSATLVAGSNIFQDDNGLDLSSTGQTVQYDWYTNPIPNVSTCSPDPFANGNSPIEQVIQYSLASGGTLSLAAGDTEVEFNYDPSVAGTPGVASFTIGGVTYTSIGAVLPTDTLNDFLFDQNGKLLGALGQDPVGNPTFTAGIPTGWTSSSGGTVSAPEIDPASAAAGLTLLMGGLAVLRGRRRLPIPSIG